VVPRSDEANAFINPKNTWPDPRQIPVCFLDVPEGQRSYIQRVVERQYGERVGFRFVGWGDCGRVSVKMTAIRIDCNDDPRYRAEGHSLVGPGRVRGANESTMVFRCEHFRQDSKFGRHLILHEFGHAMSMWHEHERDDSRCDMGDRDRSDGAHVKVGPYDPASVMNYCSDNDALTSTDIEGLRRLYPSLKNSPTPPPPTTPPTPSPPAPPPPVVPPSTGVPSGCEGSRTSCWNEAETREMAAWAACEPRLASEHNPACLEPLRRLTGALAHVRRMYQHGCDQGQRTLCGYLRSLDRPEESPRLLVACNGGRMPNVEPACKRIPLLPRMIAGAPGGRISAGAGGRRWTLGW